MSTVIFACICSVGIGACITYISVTLLRYHSETKRAPTPKKFDTEKYVYYESDDTLTIETE